MDLWIGSDIEQFAARAEGFIQSRVERNLIATVFAGARSGRYPDAIYAVVADEGGQTIGAALRTPPHNIIAAGKVPDPDGFIAGWIALDPAPGGINGEPELVRPLADAWARRTGGSVEVQFSEALHRLETLIPPEREVPGVLQPADFRQAAQLGEWGIAFAIDAGIPNPEQVADGIGHQLESQRLYVWEVDGVSVALVGHNVEVAGTVRIGPVYTPAAQRGRGYASAATAALSRRLLDAGAQRLILYTDLSNAISNHVYAKIGYVPIAAFEVLAFDRPAEGPDAG